MPFISTVVEKDHLTTIEWKKGLVVSGKSPRVAEFRDYLDNHFDFPVSVKQSSPDATATFDTVSRAVQNDFELALVAIKMGDDLKVEVITTEEI